MDKKFHPTLIYITLSEAFPKYDIAPIDDKNTVDLMDRHTYVSISNDYRCPGTFDIERPLEAIKLSRGRGSVSRDGPTALHM